MSMKDHLELIERLEAGNEEQINESKQINEEVDTTAAKKELKGKLKALKDAMDGFANMDENTFKLIEAMPNGLKAVMTIQDSFSKINTRISDLEHNLSNAQKWDAKKLGKE